MKAKELSVFLKKYALEKRAEDASANSKKKHVPEAEAEDSDDAKGKAVPQVG
jgi:hypothetical protein